MGSVVCGQCSCTKQRSASKNDITSSDEEVKNGHVDEVGPEGVTHLITAGGRPASVPENGGENILPEGLSPREVLLHPLHDIVEEDDPENIDQDSVSSSISLTLRQKICNSPSPNALPGRERKKKARTRSVTSTTSSDSGSHKMQAEQGSIGDLHKYHNKYLRSRRHTLANVR